MAGRRRSPPTHPTPAAEILCVGLCQGGWGRAQRKKISPFRCRELEPIYCPFIEMHGYKVGKLSQFCPLSFATCRTNTDIAIFVYAAEAGIFVLVTHNVLFVVRGGFFYDGRCRVVNP